MGAKELINTKRDFYSLPSSRLVVIDGSLQILLSLVECQDGSFPEVGIQLTEESFHLVDPSDHVDTAGLVG